MRVHAHTKHKAIVLATEIVDLAILWTSHFSIKQ